MNNQEDLMKRLVHYHHPLSENFSLKYSSESIAEILDEREQIADDTKVIGYPFDRSVFVIFVGDTEIQNAQEVDLDPQTLEELIDTLSRDGKIVAFRLIELLNAAVEVSEADEFRLYKSFDAEKVDAALDHVSWGTDLPTVAGDIISNLILSHALPNANHRTAIAMGQFCIECVDPEFEMPSTNIDDTSWHQWVNPYIIRSKQLITVRRNNRRFFHLQQLDVDIVERKDEIQIDLSDYELDMAIPDAHREFAHQHESLWREFVIDLIQRVGEDDLLEENGPSRDRFIDYLDSGIQQKDFEALF